MLSAAGFELSADVPCESGKVLVCHAVQADAVRRELLEADRKFHYTLSPTSTAPGGGGQAADHVQQAAMQTERACCSPRPGICQGNVSIPNA